MTTHDQHTETSVPTEEREPLDDSSTTTEYASTHDDSVTTSRQPSSGTSTLENEPPPLETMPPPAPTGTTATNQPTGTTATNQPTGTTATNQPTGTTATNEQTETTADRELFADDELAGLRARWDNVQAGFVDDPRECVHKADSLVSDVVEKLTAGFAQARSRLEEQWARGENASTEDLRVALKRYREFFQRLLSV